MTPPSWTHCASPVPLVGAGCHRTSGDAGGSRRGAWTSQARGADKCGTGHAFVREDADWLPAGTAGGPEELAGLSRQARTVFAAITRAGASFFADLVQGSRLLKSEVEAALWELVAAGLVTADGFDNLRSLIDPHAARGLGLRPRGAAAPQHGTLVTVADCGRR